MSQWIVRSSTPKRRSLFTSLQWKWGPKPFPAFGVRWKWWNSGGTTGVYRCVSAAISVSLRQSWSYGDTPLSGHHGWEHATRMGTDPERIFCWSWVDLWFLFLKFCGRNTSSFLSQAVKIGQCLIGASQAGKPLWDTWNCKCCIFLGERSFNFCQINLKGFVSGVYHFFQQHLGDWRFGCLVGQYNKLNEYLSLSPKQVGQLTWNLPWPVSMWIAEKKASKGQVCAQ